MAGGAASADLNGRAGVGRLRRPAARRPDERGGGGGGAGAALESRTAPFEPRSATRRRRSSALLRSARGASARKAAQRPRSLAAERGRLSVGIGSGVGAHSCIAPAARRGAHGASGGKGGRHRGRTARPAPPSTPRERRRSSGGKGAGESGRPSNWHGLGDCATSSQPSRLVAGGDDRAASDYPTFWRSSAGAHLAEGGRALCSAHL